MTIAIIGGGPAGMMAAATIQEMDSDIKVILIEKNSSIGRKLLLTGGGRCNLTTGIQDVRKVLSKYPRGAKFLQSAMHQFTPEDVYDWFEEHGVPLKTESDLRVFPCSNEGSDIVNVFTTLFQNSSVELILNDAVQNIEKKDAAFLVHLNSGKRFAVDKLIITTGGQAYQHTGSDGDGYSLAKSLGHSITKLAGSLSSFILQEKWVADISGVSFQQITLSVPNNKKYTSSGPMIFTHQGISGPAVFALSSLVAFEEYSEENPLQLRINFLPQTENEELIKKITTATESNPKDFFWKTLQQWVPKSVAYQFLQLAGIDEIRTNAEVSKKLRNLIVEFIKKCPVHIVGRETGNEFVTAGGVKLSEINPVTMESKICPGLHFAGEILNVDGFTGGFNLQATWATGRLAGKKAASQ